MQLIPVPDASGQSTLWINADHLASVQSIYRHGERGILLSVEMKVDGLPLQRIELGEHADRAAAEEKFGAFLRSLQEG